MRARSGGADSPGAVDGPGHPLPRKPDLFLVGAPKCGTTSMYASLRRHPAIFMSPVKEPEFFSRTPGDPDVPTLEAYLALFRAARDEKRVGEASVGYLASPTAAARIRTFNPAARILIMLRNPVDMMHALHSQLVFNGDEDVPDFEAALALEERRARGLSLPVDGRLPAWVRYRSMASYSDQVLRYLDAFGREAVRVVIFDDFARDPVAVYAGVLDFLGVEPIGAGPSVGIVNPNKQVRSRLVRGLLRRPPGIVRWLARAGLGRARRQKLARRIKQLNQRSVARTPLSADLRRRLQDELAAEVERLGALLGRDLGSWTRG
jgi:hypothetical protein